MNFLSFTMNEYLARFERWRVQDTTEAKVRAAKWRL